MVQGMGTAALDESTLLFSVLFAEQPEKNRQQLIDHFHHAVKVLSILILRCHAANCITLIEVASIQEKCFVPEQAEAGAWDKGVIIGRNILCALIQALKYLASQHVTSLQSSRLLASFHDLILGTHLLPHTGCKKLVEQLYP